MGLGYSRVRSEYQNAKSIKELQQQGEGNVEIKPFVISAVHAVTSTQIKLHLPIAPSPAGFAMSSHSMIEPRAEHAEDYAPALNREWAKHQGSGVRAGRLANAP
ncbi:unnamed protein product [Pleuronectes platessa]|uniref:Uncharacterized protein n=1 Tax=Pleuronectes platessa TaxID=8262 RepID=A0A9N7Z6V6_PLEPL|nr:unnamed protein product [Pleuronectes platessa]